MKYNLFNLKNPRICPSDYNGKWYKDFIGPIKELNNRFGLNFYLSFDESQKILIDELTVIGTKDFKNDGFVFGLFNQQSLIYEVNFSNNTKEIINNSLENMKEFQFPTNFKIIKNLGSIIKQIYLIRNFHWKKHPGILIKYSDGDECLKNNSKLLIFL